MSKRRKTEYKCKCECVIRGRGKEKKMVVRFNRIVTVPHCYPSVVLNTLEISIEVSVRIEVQFIITGEGTRVAMRGGTEIYCTSRTEVTPIVTGNAAAMSSNAVFKTMGRASDSVSLVDFGKTMSTRGGDVDVGTMRGSGSRDRRKLRTGSDTRTASSITMTSFVTPFPTVVARAMKGGPKGLRRMRGLWATRGLTRTRIGRARGRGGRRRMCGRRRGW